MNRWGVIAAALLALSGAESSGRERKPSVPPHRALTLQGAISLALKQNPDILKSIHEIERTRGQVIEVRAQALPKIQATGTYTQYDPDLLTGGGSSISSTATGSSTYSGVTVDKTWRITLDVKQTIYSGGKVRAAMKIAELTEDTSHQLLRETVATVIARVRTQFYTALLNRELITVSEESIQLLSDELQDQQNRFAAGTVPRFNVLRAEVELANARPELIRSRNNYLISRLELGKTLGLDGDEKLDVLGELRMQPHAVNLQKGIATARKNRAILKAQKDTIETEEHQITVAKSGYKPQLTASGGYEFMNNSSTRDLSNVTHGWYLGVTGTWAVFDGFETKGKVDQARARLASAKVNFSDSVQQVELEVQKAYAQAKVAREVIGSQVKVVEQAEEALRLAKERLAAGAGTQLDVLDARVALTKARTTQKQALSEYNVALAEYDRATGATAVYDPTLPGPKPKVGMGALRKGGATLRPAD